MVYFLRIPSGLVKIGTTNILRYRLQAHTTTFGRPLSLLAVIPGWEEEERLIHRHFRDIKEKRELFRYVSKLADFIEHLPPPVTQSCEEADRQPLFHDDVGFHPGTWTRKLVLGRNAPKREAAIEIRENRLVFTGPISLAAVTVAG